VDGVATHDHRGVLGVGQEGYSAGVRYGVNSAQLDINFEADVGKVLGLGSPALMTL
jgi:hypothetical protein